MRISGLANVSTGSLPDAELAAIDRLFEGSDARHPLDYHGIPVVAHPYGFLAHTCMVLDDDRAHGRLGAAMGYSVEGRTRRLRLGSVRPR